VIPAALPPKGVRVPKRRRAPCQAAESDPGWYKSGVIYELPVRAFYDADGNGTGDFQGLTEKLDYLKDLGVTALWLLPFYPSPLKDDGYDIANYCDVHPTFGTLADFRVFLREAHRRGLRVITELVLNHTSAEHPWFQRARRAPPGNRWRNFYVWSDTGREYKEARIIFKDVEVSNWTWDPVAKAYFWHRFFSHQPDLNYDNPEVQHEMIRVVDFWFDLGVDGLRLDAVPYLFERDGTNCENLPETHAFLKRLRAHVDARYADRMLLGEANQWPEDAVAYFGQGQGDECHMAFHFPLMPRLFMAVRMEDNWPVVNILEQTPAIPSTSQWALFLRNHDELTLEMVTDEERDYMYRMYAQTHQARLNLGIRRRLAPLMGNDRRRIELLNALLFSLPGTPVLYYGDEIGLGENIFLGDRNGVRTPMQWSSDKNAGFSRANPQSLYLPIILDPQCHYEAVNVEAQLANPHSLLWWMRRLLALRKRWRALGEGKCEFLQPTNHKILSYVLRFEQEILLVVANLSRFVQPVELDLSAFEERVPMELFGRIRFPTITRRPYFLTLGPHSFYWFSLEPTNHRPVAPSVNGLRNRFPEIVLREQWLEVFEGKAKETLESALPEYLNCQPWFGGRDKSVRLVTCQEVVPVPLRHGAVACFLMVQVDYVEGENERLALPLAVGTGLEAERLLQRTPGLVLARLELSHTRQRGLLYDALSCEQFCRVLLEVTQHYRPLKGFAGAIELVRPAMGRKAAESAPIPTPVLAKGDYNNSSVYYGDRFVLKLFRRLESGQNPELEIGRFLERKSFSHAARLVGALKYVSESADAMPLVTVAEFIPHSVPAWSYTLDALSRYFDRAITWVAQGLREPPIPTSALQMLSRPVPPEVAENIGTYLESARQLGMQTAELHLALASDPEAVDFKPEPFTPHYQRGLAQSMHNLAALNFRGLRQQLNSLPTELQPLARRVVEAEPAVLLHYRSTFQRPLAAKRIRIHGDLHLGQMLWTGKDFTFIDFEGEAGTALSERQIKRSPLRDVAGLLCSFQFAAQAGLMQHSERGSIPKENLNQFQSWVRYWTVWVSWSFLRAYLRTLGQSELLPPQEKELHSLLRTYFLNQMICELGRQLTRRHGWVHVPLEAVLRVLSHATFPGVAPPEVSGSVRTSAATEPGLHISP
jgi:maltose alpha-D-glucosyltransferase / alpha-amylase